MSEDEKKKLGPGAGAPSSDEQKPKDPGDTKSGDESKVDLPEPRVITTHAQNPANEALKIAVLDAPGAGGANHVYRITGFTKPAPKRETFVPADEPAADVFFQDGPIGESGVNGVTHEALLAIVADRLRCFQAGPFACRENEKALIAVEEALTWLHKRTSDRKSRQVEGKNEA